MKKFSVAAVLAASLASSAAAIDLDGFFVGAEGKYNLKSNISTLWDAGAGSPLSANIDGTSFGLGLKVGYDFDFMRIYGAYNHNFEAKENANSFANLGINATEELKWEGNDFVLGADWTPKFSLGEVNFKGILGVFGGISKIDIKYYADNIMGVPGDGIRVDENNDGFIYGLKLGAIYDLEKMGEIEFGLKYDKAKYNGDSATATEISGGMSMSGSIKTLDTKRTNMGVFVGYNYKF